MDQIWDILQIKATKDKREIKRAYARRTRDIHPEENQKEFQILYESYRKALEYASYGEWAQGTAESGIDTWQKEELPESEEERKFRQFGLDSEEIRRERDRSDQIKSFQNQWHGKVSTWEKGDEFLDGEQKRYFQSKLFEGIMWSPIVMENIAEGIIKYFCSEDEILLFFRDIYSIGSWEDIEDYERGLWIYNHLHPAYMKEVQRKQIQKEWTRKEKIAYFQICWKKQIFQWVDGGLFLNEEWIRYLRSEDFKEIMWSSAVLKDITVGMAEHCRQKQEVLLFFWDLYDFEGLREEDCTGESVLLFKKLYPAYINRIKRQQYEENKDEIRKMEVKRISKAVAIWTSIIITVVLSLIFLNETFAGAVCLIVLIGLIIWRILQE